MSNFKNGNNFKDVTSLILKASTYMDNNEYNNALDFINTGIKLNKSNYELIFMKALCFEQLGNIEYAYYLYKLAIFMADNFNPKDATLIHNEFSRMCSYNEAIPYKLGKSLEQLIIERIKLTDYSNTFEFLKMFIYDTNRLSANINLTDENMLLFMMLEIWQSEESHPNIVNCSNIKTLFSKTDCGLTLFKEICLNTKHAIRRIWLGINKQYQNYICELISKYKISPDALLILTKYSVEESFLCNVIKEIGNILKNDFPEYANFMYMHSHWLEENNLNCVNKCYHAESYTNNACIKYIDCSHSEYINNKHFVYSKRLDTKLDYSKISIIFCTNNDLYSNECILYLRQLHIPDNMSLDIIIVKNAPEMAAGYNYAMQYSDSGYKLYIHHDTFIIDRNIILKLIQTFKTDSKIGMIGNTGSTHLSKNGMWFKSDVKYRRSNIYNDILLNIQQCKSLYTSGDYEHADAIDGIFIATAYDILWRQDIFDGWHYYDISQTYEYRKAGFKTIFINFSSVTLLHETTTVKDPLDLYDKYQKIFTSYYLT